MKLQHLFESRIINALKVVQSILGDRVTDNYDNLKQGQYLVCRTWSYDGGPMWSDCDSKPGEGGSIGLRDLYGITPKDIAEAAHEAYHAYLHMTGGDHDNEKLVNQLTLKWLRQNLTGVDLQAAIEHIAHSNKSYGHPTED